MPTPIGGEEFTAKNGKQYVISSVIPQDTGGAFTVLSNKQAAENYHKKIPSTKGLEESRFAIEWDTPTASWVER